MMPPLCLLFGPIKPSDLGYPLYVLPYRSHSIFVAVLSSDSFMFFLYRGVQNNVADSKDCLTYSWSGIYHHCVKQLYTGCVTKWYGFKISVCSFKGLRELENWNFIIILISDILFMVLNICYVKSIWNVKRYWLMFKSWDNNSILCKSRFACLYVGTIFQRPNNRIKSI